MTKQQMRDRFYRKIFQAEGASKFSPAECDSFLSDKLSEVTRKFPFYVKTRVIPVAEGTNQFTLAQVKPVAVSGESFRLHTTGIIYKEGKSGVITAFAAGTGGAGFTKVTSAGHGLADGDTVEIYDSTNYTGRFTVSSKATDYFDINNTYSAETPTASTVWVVNNSNEPYNLVPGTYEEIQQLFTNWVKPSTEVPQGTLFIPWLTTSINLSALGTDLSNLIVPTELQEIIPDWSALDALQSIKDSRADSLAKMVDRQITDCQKWAEERFAENPSYFGRFRMTNGMYAYRETTNRAFIFWPRTW